MKKSTKALVLALFVLIMFVSCHECAICGKNKLVTEKKSFLGKEYYVCKDCKDAPAEAWNNLKKDVKNAVNDVSTGVQSAANEVKNAVSSAADEVKNFFGGK